MKIVINGDSKIGNRVTIRPNTLLASSKHGYGHVKDILDYTVVIDNSAHIVRYKKIE